jgi:single-strand DNA-binding protein
VRRPGLPADTNSPRTPGGDAIATDNTVTLIGNLTDAPELRFTADGAAVATFRLAVTPGSARADQWTDGEASFFRITCWRQLAENVTEILGKGARAIVIGRLRLRSWETDHGERRSVVEVEADEVVPSLKFATATVQRTNAKTAAGTGRGDQFNGEPPF